MSFDSTLNDQITQSVNKINTLLIGATPPQSVGLLDVASAETIGMSMYNAVSAQQNSQISAAAAVTTTCARILSSQGPIIPKPAPSVPQIPPFMPLNTGSSAPTEPNELLSEANGLTEDALKMLADKDKLSEQNQQDIAKLVAQLQTYLDGIKKAETDTTTPAAATTQTTPAAPAESSTGDAQKK